MTDYDAIVIGGGPAGSTAARIIAEAGFATLVIEKGQKGRDKPCAGGISIRTLEKFKLDKGDFIEREISGMQMYSPGNQVIDYNYQEPGGFTVYRNKFDSYLLDNAMTAGADISTGTIARDIFRTNSFGEVVLEKNGIAEKRSGKIIIVADGAFSSIARKAGMNGHSKSDLMICMQYEMEMNEKKINDLIGDKIELYFGESVAPGGYAWIFPKRKGVTVGLGIRWDKRKKRTGEYLDRFVRDHPVASYKLRDAMIISKTGGIVPWAGVIGKTYSDNLLIVGDAAGQVSTLTGEGIYYSMVSAKHAAKVAIEALSENDLSRNKLKKYEKEWRNEIGGDLKWGRLLRNLLLSGDKKADFLVNEAKNDRILTTMMAELISGAAQYEEIIRKNYKKDMTFLLKGLIKGIYF